MTCKNVDEEKWRRQNLDGAEINEHYFIFSQGHEPLIALCFNDSWIHATVCVFLIIACGYNLAKEVFQIFDEVRGKHDMLSQSAVALSGKCLV